MLRVCITYGQANVSANALSMEYLIPSMEADRQFQKDHVTKTVYYADAVQVALKRFVKSYPNVVLKNITVSMEATEVLEG